MQKQKALQILAGLNGQTEQQASAPTNVHIISGETGAASENGKVSVRIDGLVYGPNDSQYVEMDTLGGLEEGDIATILLTGESGHSMTPMAVGSVGAIDRITVRIAAIEADYIKVEQLDAAEARIEDLEADHVSVSDFEAEQANIDTLQANTADIATIRANSAKVANLTAAELEADHATVGSLGTTYAQINLANVDNAWIENGTVKDGAITNAMINSVSANKLTAGTIDASNITVTNLNADNITTGTINGQRIGEGSLSLSKLEDDVYTETEVNSIVDNLQSQIDGAIETWTGTDVPTLQNAPAVNWTTDAVKDTHVGDVYFVVNSQSQQNGYNYRFTKTGNTYSWQLIKDNDVTNALRRLTDAEGRIGTIETFDTTVSSFMTNTDAELTSIKSAATTLEGRVDTAEGTLATKVDTSTFNTLSQTVGENTSSISNLTETVTTTTQRLDNLRAGSTNLLVLSTSLDKRYFSSNGKSLVSNNASYGSSNHSVPIDIEAGADYCLSWYYAPTLPSGYKQYLYALFYDDEDAYLGFAPNPYSDISGIDSGTYHMVAPENATKAIICFPKTFLNREDMGFTGYGLKFEKGSVPTDFSLAPYDAEVHPNILRGTNQPDTLSTVYQQGSGGWRKGEWGEGSGNANSGSVTIIEIDDPPSPEQKYAFRVYSSTTGNKDVTQYGGLPFPEVCTLSFWTRVPEESSVDSPVAQVRVWTTSAIKTYTSTLSKETSWVYHKITWSFTEAQLASNPGLIAGVKGKGTIDYCGLKLESGFIATPWIPAHEDYAGAHYLENLAIGGRNLLLGTATPFTLSVGYANLPYGLSDEFDNFATYDDITLSFWADTEIDCWIDFYWCGNSTTYNNANNFYPAFSLTAGKNYYTVTGQTGLNIANALYLRVRQSDEEHGASAQISDITFTDVKLERGTRASTWSPAPEDVETAITTVSNTVNTVSQTVDTNSAKITNLTTVLGTNADGTTSSTDIVHRTSAIEQDLSSFKTTVSETYSTKTETSSIESRVSTAESTISQHSTSIALKANSSDVYTKTQSDGLISTEVTNRNTAISAATDAINLSVSQNYATKTALSDGLDAANDYTDTEVSSAKAAIKVTTDSISTEVAKKVNGTEVISSINQSAETVKIQASKVQIDGTAIFNAISSDVDSAITSKGYSTTSQTLNRTHRIYFRSNSNVAPAIPVNWVTADGDVDTTWTTKHVAITSVRKYIYTCEQYEMANGTINCTSVLRDDTITVIDGGNIITGSVSANAVNAASGTFDVANIPILNATKINVDSITRIGPSDGNHVAIDSGSFDFVDGTTDVATLELLNSDPNDVTVNLRLDGGFGDNYLSAYSGRVVYDSSSDTTSLTSSLAAHYYGTPSASDRQLNLSSIAVRSGAYLSDIYMQARDITVIPIKQTPITIYNAPLDNFGHLIRSRVDIAWTTINVGANTGNADGVTLTWCGGGFADENYIVSISRMNAPNGYTHVQFAVIARSETTVTIGYWNDGSSAVNGLQVGVIGADSRYGTAV